MRIAGVEVATAHPGGLRTPVNQRPLLFRPITMRGVTARNRIMLGPMSQYLSIDGNLTDWHDSWGSWISDQPVPLARRQSPHRCLWVNSHQHSWFDHRRAGDPVP